ncbi:Nudix hydrolase 3 [Dichanthelium oligosanthes]|uniref:Nudix hydrolase 3 n=1 Tax=Dichanthelium oligosanthes TaxID=888268 RepID=A0A1E5W005_9POAL|nr:Nudix hydrolase 3 [Dichanthelium oligosanthes]
MAAAPEERLDILNAAGEKTGVSKPRHAPVRAGTLPGPVGFLRSNRVIPALMLLASFSLGRRRELEEELGIKLPVDAFELIFEFLQESVINNGTYTNNEYNDVYLVTTLTPIPLEAFTLQESEVSSVRYMRCDEYKNCLAKESGEYVPYDVDGQYGQLFSIIEERSCLDENKAFLSTADSAVKLLTDATKPVSGWKGVEYRAAFPRDKPPGANFYPPDMDKMEFGLWKNGLTDKEQKDATGFFTVVKRRDSLSSSSLTQSNGSDQTKTSDDLFIVPYSKEYRSSLEKAAELLEKASACSDSPSLKNLLRTKANAFLSNDYYESDISWMELDLERNLPMDNIFKSDSISAAPIRVINLLYNSGFACSPYYVLSGMVAIQDVKGPQTIAFNLPNDERIVNERGTSMVMLKNISEAKFKHILKPIADACIKEEQKEYVDFEPYYTHIVCHECCHGIGPHSITLPTGKKSTELQEFHSALEEAKADIVGLWALNFLIKKGLLPNSLSQSMYVSFLAGCFRSIRFGLEEAHGKGQALQFNWLYDKGAFALHPDGKFSVDFTKVEDAVESLSREILTIQAKGDKPSARSLLQSRATLTQPLRVALEKIEHMQVPVDIAPKFGTANKLLGTI